MPAAEYLSGNVRAKLDHARQAARERPELEAGVRALERVLPADLTVEEIEPRGELAMGLAATGGAPLAGLVATVGGLSAVWVAGAAVAAAALIVAREAARRQAG